MGREACRGRAAPTPTPWAAPSTVRYRSGGPVPRGQSVPRLLTEPRRGPDTEGLRASSEGDKGVEEHHQRGGCFGDAADSH